jgi:hypothetical protein
MNTWCAAMAALTITLVARGALAGMFEQLPDDVRARLERGEQVVRTESKEGSAWPAVTVYQMVAASPEEAMAVFTDYGAQASYLGDCCGLLQSVVRDAAVGDDPRAQRVFYEVSVPVVGKDQYELVEVMSKGDDDSYGVSWRKVGGGGHSEAISGRAHFEPHHYKTLFYYHNFAKVNAFGAGLFSDWSVDKTKTTVDAMSKHMEQMHASGGAELEAEIARLHAALGS